MRERGYGTVPGAPDNLFEHGALAPRLGTPLASRMRRGRTYAHSDEHFSEKALGSAEQHLRERSRRQAQPQRLRDTGRQLLGRASLRCFNKKETVKRPADFATFRNKLMHFNLDRDSTKVEAPPKRVPQFA